MPAEEIVKTNPDPTKNVLDLVEAAIQRINDLREAEAKRVDQIFYEHEVRYEQRFSDTKIAIDAALIAADKAVAAALAGQKEAVTKAEVAAEKRFESVNEFRNTLSDQQRNLMPRSEAIVLIQTLSEKITDLQARVDKSEGRGLGANQLWGYILGGVGLVATLLAILSRI